VIQDEQEVIRLCNTLFMFTDTQTNKQTNKQAPSHNLIPSFTSVMFTDTQTNRQAPLHHLTALSELIRLCRVG